MVATHLPSDSELIFFKTTEEAKAEFKKRTQELFELDGLEEDIDYSIERSNTIYGVIGIKVWIYKGDIYKK